MLILPPAFFNKKENGEDMKYIFLFFMFMASFVCRAQSHTSDITKLEKQAKQLVLKKPDSALILIKKILSHHSLPDSVYGATYNIYGTYYRMRGNNDSLIHYQKKSISYLEKYPLKRAGSLLNLSVGYKNKGMFDEALNTLEKALEINQRIKNNVGIAMNYGEMASVYNTKAEYDKSVKYLLQAIDILKKEKNKDRLPPLQQRLGNTYLALENFPFAIDLYKESLAAFKEKGEMKNYYLTLSNIAEAYIHTDNLKAAIAALRESLIGIEEFGDKALLGITRAKMGHVEELLGNHAKAVANYETGVNLLSASGNNRVIRIAGEYIDILCKHKEYKKALTVIKQVDALKMFEAANSEDQALYKKAVGDAYSGTDNTDAAISAYQKTIALKDSIAHTDREKAIQEVQAKFQTQLQREQNLTLDANNKILEATLWLYIIGGIALLALGFLSLRGYWLKNRLQKEQLKNLGAEKEMITQQHLHEQELTNAQKDIIDEKQRELTSTALRMANFQDSLNQIIDKCNSGEISRVTDLKKELQLLSKQEDYWKQFETRFNHLHPEFGTSLQNRFEKLTKNDIEFCSLLKLNLSNKEIASLLQISHESVITKKYRIKKKMEIQDDNEFERMLLKM